MVLDCDRRTTEICVVANDFSLVVERVMARNARFRTEVGELVTGGEIWGFADIALLDNTSRGITDLTSKTQADSLSVQKKKYHVSQKIERR